MNVVIDNNSAQLGEDVDLSAVTDNVTFWPEDLRPSNATFTLDPEDEDTDTEDYLRQTIQRPCKIHLIMPKPSPVVWHKVAMLGQGLLLLLSLLVKQKLWSVKAFKLAVRILM